MPATILAREAGDIYKPLSTVMPGSMSHIDKKPAEFAGYAVLAVCCDKDDIATDIFICEVPETLENPLEGIDPDIHFTKDNLYRQILPYGYIEFDVVDPRPGGTTFTLFMSHLLNESRLN